MCRTLALFVFASGLFAVAPSQAATRYMENLDRGVVAVYVPGSGIYVGWRMFGTDPASIGFNVYRNGVKITSSPITTSTNYMDASGSTSSTYYVRPVIGGVEQAASETATVWASYISGSSTPLRFKDVPIQKPADVVRPDGSIRTYSANDCSTGDLDGDGKYEIVVKWDPNDSKDNSQSGVTGNVYLDAYKLDGTFMWRIDLGRNIRAGAHYTQFMVYDLDGDGRAEVACKTAPGTVDGMGNNVLMGTDDPAADYRNSSGYILSGPEYLTIFSGLTGGALTTTAYDPPRGTVSAWGDSYGNRVDRFLACVAYLDGVRPSLVMCRGYYTRAVLVAYNWRGGQLTKVWKFDSDDGTTGNSAYRGQGNHNLAVGDVDGDGYDEIVYGSCCIDHNGKGKYVTGLGHGDAMHFGDLDPNRPGLEVFQCHEGGSGESFRDAGTGKVIWQNKISSDNGRAGTADIDPCSPGEECWSTEPNLKNANGTVNSTNRPSIYNFAIWWDADLSRELFDADRIDKWNASSKSQSRLVTVYNYGTSTNNGTKKNPCLQADILGDWREEFIERTNDSTALRIFTPVTVTSYRIFTLMHDPIYRMGIAWQNVAYNQPPHTGFFLGNGMTFPVPSPDILLVGSTPDTTPPTPDPMTWQAVPYATGPATISMVAADAIDESDAEYYFACVSGGGHDSGWQSSATYTDTALASNTTYSYKVMARDKSPDQNQGGWSSVAAATTAAIDTTPPTPSPMTWQLYPYATGTSSITMTASAATDESGAEYNFVCVSGGGHSSGWQASQTYTDTVLSAGTTYQYKVQARDKSSNLNLTDFSSTRAATTYTASGMTQYQAEDQTWYLAVTETVNAGYTGLSYVNTDNVIGSWVQWTVTVPAAGPYAIDIRFANQPAANRNMSISVNGTVVVPSFDFLTTGAWTTWAVNTTTLNLNAGSNTIRFTSLTANGAPNLDRLDVTTPTVDMTPPSPSPMEWSVVPAAMSYDTIAMTARTAGDASGVQYYFANLSITDGSHDSGWQDSTNYSDNGLSNGTTYTYSVIARDKSAQANMTAASNEAAATTPVFSCQVRPSSDVSGDCRVDFADFSIIADGYISASAGSVADIDGNGTIDVNDLALLAEQWLACGRMPNEQCPQ
jgi:rhamnogalacturonan endolyase